MKFTGADVGGDPFEDVITNQQIIGIMESDMAEGVAGGVMHDDGGSFAGENLCIGEGVRIDFGDDHGTVTKEIDNGIENCMGCSPGSEAIGESIREFGGPFDGIIEDDPILGMNPDLSGTEFDDFPGEADVIGVTVSEDQPFDLFDAKTEFIESAAEGAEGFFRIESGIDECQGPIDDQPGVDFAFKEGVGEGNAMDDPRSLGGSVHDFFCESMCIWRSSRFRIFPEGPLGSGVERISTMRGYL